MTVDCLNCGEDINDGTFFCEGCRKHLALSDRIDLVKEAEVFEHLTEKDKRKLIYNKGEKAQQKGA